MRGVGAKAERSDPTTLDEVAASDCPSEASAADLVCGPGQEADCPVSNDWDEV
jgi:hypothetical protein